MPPPPHRPALTRPYARSAPQDPSNEYVKLTLLPGWLALQRLRATPAASLGALLRLAADAATAAAAAVGAGALVAIDVCGASVDCVTDVPRTLTPRRGSGGRPKGSKDKVKRKPGGGRPKGAKDKQPRVRRSPAADGTSRALGGVPVPLALRLEGGDSRDAEVVAVAAEEAGAMADGAEVMAVVDADEVIAVEAAME
eukprot:scaffold2072_cov126-Isochrysis_galbana.AAC.5